MYIKLIQYYTSNFKTAKSDENGITGNRYVLCRYKYIHIEKVKQKICTWKSSSNKKVFKTRHPRKVEENIPDFDAETGTFPHHFYLHLFFPQKLAFCLILLTRFLRGAIQLFPLFNINSKVRRVSNNFHALRDFFHRIPAF